MGGGSGLILSAATIRSFATGLVGVMLGLYVAALGLGAGMLGIVVAVGFAGNAVAIGFVAAAAERLGRRPTLLLVSALSALGTAALAAVGTPAPILAAAFLGMVNGMGQDRGAAQAIDQAILADRVADTERTGLFVRYTLLQDVAAGFGSLALGAAAWLQSAGLSPLGSYRALFALAAALAAIQVLLYSRLREPGGRGADETGKGGAHGAPGSPPARPGRRGADDGHIGARGGRGAELVSGTEDAGARPDGGAASGEAERPPERPAERPPERPAERPGHAREISATAKRRVAGLSTLFAVDSVGGGFLAGAILSYWFFRRFGLGPEAVGGIFFAARILNALSYLAAGRLAKKIGLVRTMVFTHLPASAMLLALPLIGPLWLAVTVFLVREALVQMDVPTRQSYVAAIVAPHERPFALATTSLVRYAGWTVGPGLAGFAMTALGLGAPLVAGASLKIVYDLSLFAAFRKLRPPEERPAA